MGILARVKRALHGDFGKSKASIAWGFWQKQSEHCMGILARVKRALHGDFGKSKASTAWGFWQNQSEHCMGILAKAKLALQGILAKSKRALHRDCNVAEQQGNCNQGCRRWLLPFLVRQPFLQVPSHWSVYQ